MSEMAAVGQKEVLIGHFYVEGLHLALAMENLREVVPCSHIAALPTAQAGLLGAVDLRGVPVPVINLQAFLGQPYTPHAYESIVIVGDGKKLLGIVADGVGEVMKIQPIPISDKEGANLFTAAFSMQDGQVVSVISAARLFDMSGIPATDASQAMTKNHYAHADDQTFSVGEEASANHVMLMQSNGIPLALVSHVIYTIILNPTIHNSPIKTGYCLGTLDFNGHQIPVLDLLGVCQLANNVGTRLRQAFLVHVEDGYVAFMVDEIIDVVLLQHTEAVALPGLSFPKPECFLNAIPVSALPAESHAANASACGYYLQVNPSMLSSGKELEILARMNTPLSGSAKENSSDTDLRIRQQQNLIQMLSYDVGFEVASPVDQIAEMIPWNPDTSLLGLNCERAGLVINRGRSIPIYCLVHLLGFETKPPSATASILVIEEGDTVVGFAVPGLITIESGVYDKQHQSIAPDQFGRPGFGHLMIGNEMNQRMIGTLDLKAMAAFVKSDAFLSLQSAIKNQPVSPPVTA
ncbi:chemotaxis protein CheW [Leeia sp. TBRC 13508]|uniref:Chemotaxis protein CheW n=1 Tax=Leeia speluncae TaxID=2884804 RepID=A0ABS8D8I6_9NEIS|nr:chemotaxis protein CheW [Leeia speluncae]MCB6184520.1 chemotaxis protein CheW [Leeia speluncae]